MDWRNSIKIDTNLDWKSVSCHLASDGGIEYCSKTETRTYRSRSFISWLIGISPTMHVKLKMALCSLTSTEWKNKFNFCLTKWENLKVSGWVWCLFLVDTHWVLLPNYDFLNSHLIVWGTNQPSNDVGAEKKAFGCSYNMEVSDCHACMREILSSLHNHKTTSMFYMYEVNIVKKILCKFCIQKKRTKVETQICHINSRSHWYKTDYILYNTLCSIYKQVLLSIL